MTTQKCHVCYQACNDGFACSGCASKARRHLWAIGYLLGHVDAKRARIGSKVSVGAGPRDSETPLPFDPRVTAVLRPVEVALLQSAEIIREADGGKADYPTAPDWRRLAFWIGGHAEMLRKMPEGPEEFMAFEQLSGRLDRLFDRPPDTLYLGQCRAEQEGGECSEYVYVELARELPAYAYCPQCEARVDVSERREFFREQVAIYQATMAELVTLAPLFLDEGVSQRTLHEWTRRGFLRPAGERMVPDWKGRWQPRPTYRISDLAGAASQWAALKESRRRGKKSA